MLRRTTPDPDDPRPLTPLLIPTADPARHPPLGLDLGRDTCVPAATTLTANALIIATVRAAPKERERRAWRRERNKREMLGKSRVSDRPTGGEPGTERPGRISLISPHEQLELRFRADDAKDARF